MRTGDFTLAALTAPGVGVLRAKVGRLSTIDKVAAESPSWNFLSKDIHALICVAQNPRARVSDVAARGRVTERAALRIVARFEKAGTLAREKEGRRNHHQIHKEQLRHRLESHCTVTSLLAMVLAKPRDEGDRDRADADLSADLGTH